MKLYVHYDPLSDNAWNDGDTERRAREWARAIKTSATDIHITTANELSTFAFRVLVKEKVLDHKQLVFIHNGIEYTVNKDGRFTHCDIPPSVVDSLLMRLV